MSALWRNSRLTTLAAPTGWGLLERGAMLVDGKALQWVGSEADLPAGLSVDAEHDLRGALVTPGLVDCHTHLVFGGNRAREFELRLEGASYEEISRAGGGIASTVAATRAASLDSLTTSARRRLDGLKAGGVTTVEIKSGYGLDLDTELRMLAAATALGAEDVRVRRTFLALHALAPEYAQDRAGYVRLVADVMIPAVAAAHAADAVDAFCDNIGFTASETETVFAAARAHGLPVKLHAEQLSDQNGAALAARYKALSADHLEWLSDDGVAAMAESGTVAVLLPGAFYALRETRLPPIDKLRAAGVAMAVATDCNPGTSPLTSILLTMNMAATLFRLTVDECLAGVTREAARALGRQAEIGTLEAGKWCDLAIWDVESAADLVYQIGANPLHARIWRGA